MIDNNNYYVVQGWMINELHLKGNELSVYAIIYGFSQAENQCYNGSLQYLANWTGATKTGIMKNLKSLEDKGLIIKTAYIKNNIKFCEYRTTKLYGMQQSCMGGIQLSLPNNKDIDNIEYIKEREKEKPTYNEVEEYAKSRNRIDLAKAFYDYYTTGNWKDKDGKTVKNWKQKFITWENHDSKPKDNFIKNSYSKEQINSLITDLDNVKI